MRIFLYLLPIVFVVLSGCMHSATSTELDNEDDFEEQHAQEMDEKATLPGTGSATTELLYPAEAYPIDTGWVTYGNGFTGYLSTPEGVDDAPGIVVIHEWRGLNEHIIDMTKVLAAEGYRALAVDLYDGQVAADATEARELVGSVEQDAALQNLLAAEDFLRNDQGATQVASLGRCFGGAQSLQMSLASETLDATVIYYGQLATGTDTLARIQSPILGVFAEEDGSIPPSDVAAFTSALSEIDKQFDVTVYSGVDHAFANPTGGNHNPAATRTAWERTLQFLSEQLQ